MNRSKAIVEELNAMGSPLADFPASLPFQVPLGYFQNLATQLAAGNRYADAPDPNTSDLPDVVPFQTPEGYFEKLTEQLMAGTATSSLPRIKKEHPFTVPEGYFESLPGQLLKTAKLTALHKDSTIIILRTRPWRKWTLAAAAAILLLCLSLGSYHYYDSRTPDTLAAHQLAQLNPDSISEYVAQHLDEFDNDALENMVANASIPEDLQLPAIDEQDIQQYLEENGEYNATAPHQASEHL